MDIGTAAATLSSGPRFFHFVIGGSTPAAMSADWLTSLLDQNTFSRVSSDFGSAVEDVALQWLCELVGLPSSWGGALVSSATFANFTGLACATHWWGEQYGVNVTAQGLRYCPRKPNGITLWLLTAWFLYEAVQRLLHPPEVAGGLVLGIALVGIVVNTIASWLVARADRASLNVEGAFQHILNDLFALIATAVAGLVIVLTGSGQADAMSSWMRSMLTGCRASGRWFPAATPPAFCCSSRWRLLLWLNQQPSHDGDRGGPRRGSAYVGGRLSAGARASLPRRPRGRAYGVLLVAYQALPLGISPRR